MKQAAVYARVSTTGQTLENQLRELRQAAKRHGWTVVKEYVDHGASGVNVSRTAYQDLLKASMRKEHDVVMAWSVDRLGRSLKHLLGFLEDLHAKGIDLYLHQQGIDTTTPGGKALFQMMGVFAEFERSMIRERVMAGLERARAQGKTLGRPRVSKRIEYRIRQAREKGTGIRAISKKLGVGVSVVQRVLAEPEDTLTTHGRFGQR